MFRYPEGHKLICLVPFVSKEIFVEKSVILQSEIRMRPSTAEDTQVMPDFPELRLYVSFSSLDEDVDI